MTNTFKLVLSLIIFLLGFILGTRYTQDKGGFSEGNTKVKTDYIYIHDTIPRDVVKYVNVEKPTLKVVYKDRIIPITQPDSTPTLSVREYGDTIQIEKNVKGFYQATTTGTLDHIRLGFKDTRPEIRTTLQITNTVETKVPITGLFIGGFSAPNISSYGPQVQIVMPKVLFGIGYDVGSDQKEPLNRARLNLGFKIK